MAFTVTLNNGTLYFSMFMFIVVTSLYFSVTSTDRMEVRSTWDSATDVVYDNPIGYFKACASGKSIKNTALPPVDLGTYCDNIDKDCASCYGEFYCASVTDCDKFQAGRVFLVMAVVFGLLQWIAMAAWGWWIYKYDVNHRFLRRTIFSFAIIQFLLGLISVSAVTSVLSDPSGNISSNVATIQVLSVTRDDSFRTLTAAVILNVLSVCIYAYHLYHRKESSDFTPVPGSQQADSSLLTLETHPGYQTEHL